MADEEKINQVREILASMQRNMAAVEKDFWDAMATIASGQKEQDDMLARILENDPNEKTKAAIEAVLQKNREKKAGEQ